MKLLDDYKIFAIIDGGVIPVHIVFQFIACAVKLLAGGVARHVIDGYYVGLMLAVCDNDAAPWLRQ